MRRERLTNVQWGVLALVLIGVLTYFGFAKDNPFTHPFELKAMFETTSNLQPNSPVRVAGVDVFFLSKFFSAF
jgi:ABC-type transporter Mla subunit MlaD